MSELDCWKFQLHTSFTSCKHYKNSSGVISYNLTQLSLSRCDCEHAQTMLNIMSFKYASFYDTLLTNDKIVLTGNHFLDCVILSNSELNLESGMLLEKKHIIY